MGEDKSLLPFERFETLIEYQVDKYSKIFETIYISTKTDKYSFLKDRYNIEFIFDENKEFSPMIALSSVFEKIESEYMFITTVDVPFINDQVIKKLFESIKDNEIAIAVNNKKIHNLCGVFSQKVKKRVDLLLSNSDHKINNLIKSSIVDYIDFPQSALFTNLNTRSEYLNAIRTVNNSH